MPMGSGQPVGHFGSVDSPGSTTGGGAGGLAAASRNALGLVSAASLSAGTSCVVLDVGDGFPATYWLNQDARAADGVLRIAALGKAGYLWVAGDGVGLPRTYVSPKLDMTVASTNNVWFGGAAGAADLVFESASNNVMIVASTLTGTAASPVTTAPISNAGNNGGKTNMFSSQATPSLTSLNNAYNDGTIGFPIRSTAAPAAGSRIFTLDSAVKIDVTTPAAGANLTALAYRYLVVGVLMAAASLASVTLWSFSDAGTSRIATTSERPPAQDVYVSSDVPVIPVPAKVTISADVAWNGNPFPPGTTEIDIDAYLNTKGLDLASRAFADGSAIARMRIPATLVDGAFHTVTFVDFTTPGNAFVNIAGTSTIDSFYFWCPTSFPDFFEGDWFIKNVNIQIVST